MTHVRPYQPSDRAACLAVLRSNVPEHFLASDEAELARFLDDLPGPYWVVEEDRRVVACGGIALEDDPTVATLCWGIVAADRHRAGLGSALLEHRVRSFLAVQPTVRTMRVNTTQKVQRFFARHGFVAEETRPDGFGPGLDAVRMVRHLRDPAGGAEPGRAGGAPPP